MGNRSRNHYHMPGQVKNKLGCMWSWISMFDIEIGRGNQKLLSDIGCKSLNAFDIGAPKRKIKTLKDVENISQYIEDGIMGVELMAHANRQSVKKLIEEEMVSESTKERNKITLSGSELSSRVKRNQKEATKMCKTSSQINNPDTNIIEKSGSDDHESDLYIEAIMQEIFNHIQQKGISWSNNQQGEPLQSEQKLSLLEEKISEATKTIMQQKFLNDEHLTEAQKLQYYNKYMDTLEMLHTNKEFFLKLLEDPKSSLTKQLKKMPSNSSIPKPHRSNNSELSDKIVILKPGRTELLASATESSSLVRNNTAPQFSLSEIRKKLTLTLQKDCHKTSTGDVLSVSVNKYQNPRIGDNALRSTNRNHFYVEKIPRPSCGSKLADKVMNKGDASAKQRVSSIYIEAKGQLSELLSKGDKDEGLASIRTPRTLGRLLSFPESDISHCQIPGRISIFNELEAQSCSTNSQEFESLYQVDLEDLWSKSSENDLCASEDNSSNVPGGMEDVETTDSVNSEPDVICESTSLIVSSGEQNTCMEEVDEVTASSDSEDNEQDTQEEYIVSSPSPLVHPFYSAISIDTDDLANPVDKPERPSPVSVLQYVFSEDEFSPAGVESHLGSVEPRRLRPIRIQFDEAELSTTAHNVYIQGCLDNQEISFKYVEAVLSLTELCLEKLYMTSLVSSQLLSESLFGEVEELFGQLPHYGRRLLFDRVNEILNGMCQRYFSGCPLISFLNVNIRPVPNPQHAVKEVWEGVEWHLLPPPHPRSLEQIVRRDLERDRVWMDLTLDVEELIVEMETTILQELVDDAVVSCIMVLVR